MIGLQGLSRSAKHDAKSDLAFLRAAVTREDVLLRLRKLKDSVVEQPAAGVASGRSEPPDVSGPKAISLAEPLPQPGQTHPCGGAHPVGETGHANCIAQPAESDGDTGIEQPAAGAKAVTQSNTAFCQKLPVKRARIAIESSSSGVAQSAAAKQFPSHAGRVLNTESSADLKSEENRKTLLLQLRRPHYDAIKDRRKLWEARPLFDGSGRQTIHDKLAVVGNAAVLQSGAGTNDRVCIAEVRRYVPQGLSYPLDDMVVELGADLLPDVADTKGRAQIYESLYGFHRCARGFVAMRLEWPNEASAASKKPLHGCSMQSGVSPTSPSTAAAPSSGSSIAQPAASSRSAEGGVNKPAAKAQGVNQSAQASTCSGFEQPLAKNARVATEVASSGGAHSAVSSDDQEVLLLQLQPRHYDAIKSRRQRWEARPLFRDDNRGRGPSLHDKLATVGRVVVLQNGAGTGRVRTAETSLLRIAEVRRYTSVQDMVSELAADLLPDHTDRVQVYRDLYGDLGCARGFVAMRLEWPNEGAVDTELQL